MRYEKEICSGEDVIKENDESVEENKEEGIEENTWLVDW